MDGGRWLVCCLALLLSILYGEVFEDVPTDANHGKREPLCAFLDKPVPEKAFPSGNAPPSFAKRIAERRKPQYRHAAVNLAKTLGVMVAVIIAVWMAHAKT